MRRLALVFSLAAVATGAAATPRAALKPETPNH
jgi:hypothetical protein